MVCLQFSHNAALAAAAQNHAGFIAANAIYSHIGVNGAPGKIAPRRPVTQAMPAKTSSAVRDRTPKASSGGGTVPSISATC